MHVKHELKADWFYVEFATTLALANVPSLAANGYA
jgi:hypothetical protein